MTYQSYKEELQCLREIENDLTAVLVILQEGLWNTEYGNRRAKHLCKDLHSISRYRNQLARWFNGSRIGNPPVLR